MDALLRRLGVVLLALGLSAGCGQQISDLDGGVPGGGQDAGLDAGDADDGGDDPSDAGWDAGQDGGSEGQPVETTLTSGPEGTVSSDTAVFEFTASLAGSTFLCALDAEASELCSSPQTYEALADGEHTFTVQAVGPDAGPDASPASRTWTVDSTLPPTVRMRVMAANISSGNSQSYQAEGTRIFQGLTPDVVLIQEFTVDATLGTIDQWVDSTFGTEFEWFREPVGAGENIPNGVISRWPIVSAGEWTQPNEPGAGETRDFVWAQIDIPGPTDLWVISVHLATDDDDRPLEAPVLVSFIEENIPEEDFLVVGGDLNTDNRSDAAISALAAVVDVAAPYPVDQAGNGATSAPRTKYYDWVLTDSDLRPYETPVLVGDSSFPNGLVFDSRVYTPLTDVSPVQVGDSAATNMQHMAVIRDFLLTQ